MILMSLHNIRKGYPNGDVLTGVDWEIKSGQKIALLGKNGSGKSTLLGVISGRITADDGNRSMARGIRVVEMSQIPDRDIDDPLFDYVIAARTDILNLRDEIDRLHSEIAAAPEDTTLQDKLSHAQSEMERLDGYTLDQRVTSILQGLGFVGSQFAQPLARFSGGERTRIELARLLLAPADLLLLDEPTNHLDIPAVEWLEQFLIDAPCAVVLVSHDRLFLERFAGLVVEMTDGRLEHYDGDYLYYQREKPLQLARRQKAYDMQQAEIARIEDFIARNIAGQKTKQAQSRRHALTKLERLERPKGDDRAMKIGFVAERRPYREVLTVSDYTKSIGSRLLLDGVTFTCERGDKVGVIGPNGTGKSTMLRSVVGADDDYSGRVTFGERVDVAYFDQNLETLSGTGTVIDEIWESYPYFDAGELRSYLARFLFTGEDVFKSVANLSGGEKNRLALAKLMLTNANLLILDEPTNHLDIAAREILEEALAEFEGTAVVVSHDRRFLDRFATKILYVADRTTTLSLGNYSDWARRQTSAREFAQKTEKKAEPSDAARAWQEQKRIRTAERRLAKQKKELEEAIAQCERRLQEVETTLAEESTARDWKRLAALTDARDEVYHELGDLYDRLEELLASDDAAEVEPEDRG